MTTLNDKFLPLLPKRGRIIDVGAGDGRWSKKFLEMGLEVTAVDVKDRPAALPAAINWTKADLSTELPPLDVGVTALYFRNVIQFLPKERFANAVLPWAKSLLHHGGLIAVETFFDRIHPAPGPKPHPAYYSEAELKTLCGDMEILWSTHFKANLKDMAGETREFSIAQIVARKR